MKRLFICTAVLFICISLFAENTSSLPRYKGFAIGGDAFGQFPIGYYSKFANANIGLSLAGEYWVRMYSHFYFDSFGNTQFEIVCPGATTAEKTYNP